MKANYNYALYYPTIEFQDYHWLWSAALVWDRIYRIVPSNYVPDEPRNVKVLCEAGEIGIPIRPDQYASDIAEEFINKLETEGWDAAALKFDIPEEYARLHHDKVDVKLRKLIVAKGKGTSHDEWLDVPTEFEALYMTYLANRISEKNNLQILSDSAAAWTGSTYFRFDGKVEEYPLEDCTQQLATLVIRDFIPENLLAISPDDLLSFREKYRDERTRFLSSIKQAAKQLSDCDDPSVVRDHLEDIKKDIESALTDYKKSMKVLNIVGWTGIKSLSFPVLTKVITKIIGKELDVTTLSILSALGIGMGVVSGFSEWKHKRRILSKESDYSYLLHLSRRWKGSARYNHDYNYFLCREMEEFIND